MRALVWSLVYFYSPALDSQRLNKIFQFYSVLRVFKIKYIIARTFSIFKSFMTVCGVIYTPFSYEKNLINNVWTYNGIYLQAENV